jgi:Ca-activated chloride channel family protein
LTKVIASAPGSWERVILLLTDGEVGNEQEILNLVRRYQKNIRFFSLGIGSGPNEHLIKALARVGKGASEFVFPGERIELKVLRIYKKMMDPVLDDPEIYWGADEVEQAPQLPALFLDTPTTVLARFKDDFWAESKVKLKASLQGREAEWEFKVVDGAAREIPIPLLWARERIRDLEESLEGFDVSGSGRTGGKSSKQGAEIISLSEEFGLLSSLTSFVAVEERKEKATGEIILRKIPALVTIGWHGLGSVRDTQVNFCRSVPANDQPGVGLFQESIPRDFSSFKKVPISQVDHSKIQTTDIVLAILSLQKADGGFNLDRPIAKLLRMDFDKIRIAAFDISVSIIADKFILLTTAILLEVLEIYFKELEEMWRGLAVKSQNWLDSCYQVGRPSIYGKDFKSWVKRYVRDEINPVR